MAKREEVLFLKLKQKKLQFKHVAEVGVYLPETSNIGAFAKEGIKSTFVEPDPNSLKIIREYFKKDMSRGSLLQKTPTARTF